MKKINVGVIGVGNCFAGLYQGIEYYKRNPNQKKIGLMKEEICGYKLEDIEFTSAFDISKRKIGKTLDKAQYEKPNIVDWIKDMPESKVIIREAPILDGVGKYVKEEFDPIQSKKSEKHLKEEILDEIKNSKTKILLNYLPVGSENAAKFWADIALESNCAFINCMPVFIASDKEWANKFKEKNLPIIGDDIKAQVGSTIIHRVLTKIIVERGAIIENTYQLNVGGNTDFLNMKEHERLLNKKKSKTQSVQSQLNKPLPAKNIHIGPSDYIPFLKNTKIGFIRIEGKMFANIPFNIELKLEVDDKANSAGVSVDAIRCAQIALDRKIGGNIESASAYFMKSPIKQYNDFEAKKLVEIFLFSK